MGQGSGETFSYVLCGIFVPYIPNMWPENANILLKASAVLISKLSSLHLVFGIPAFMLKGEPLVLVPARVKNCVQAVDMRKNTAVQ